DVFRDGLAVADVGTYVWQRREKAAHLGGERMFAAAACAVQPPDLSLGTLVRQRVKHGEQWRRADARTDEKHGAALRLADEGSRRRGNIDAVVDLEPGVQIAAGRAAAFALDADPVVADPRRPGQRIVAQQRPVLVVGLDAQREVLAGTRRWKRRAVGTLQADGDH